MQGQTAMASNVSDLQEAELTPQELHAFSLQALNEHISGPRMIQHGFSTLTLKGVSVRSPHAFSDALRTKRIRIAEQVFNFHVHDREIFFIDESSWTTMHRRRSGRVLAGQQASDHRRLNTKVSLTCITAILTTGKKYSHLLPGTVDRNAFMTFIRTFLSHSEEDGCANSIIMFMDNASVHDKQALVESCRVKNHTLVMGPETRPR